MPPKRLSRSGATKKLNENRKKHIRKVKNEEEEIEKSQEDEDNKKEEEEKKENPNDNSNESDSDLDPMVDLDNDAPPEYLCPITMSIMRDPVIMPDGQTYERKAIEHSLEVNPISPLTREPMNINQARTNYALKNLIDRYIQTHVHEIEKEPTVIDPTTMFQQRVEPQIPITNIDQIQLETFSAQYTKDSMLITAKPQNINGRLPVSLIAIIDVSTSMIIDATLKDLTNESNSISRIQLVQYSLKTIISILGSYDKLTIITFSNKAKVIASGVLLTNEGKEKVNKIIDEIDPDGSTNLWDGLNKGINEAIKQQNNKMNTSIIVFTDGQPNIHPPMGTIPTLKDKLEDLSIYFSISTFGYGYNIEADLLEEIAEIGNGVYGYIPDASMVGTIFINYISNLVSIVSPLNVLSVTFKNKKPKKFNVILYNGSPTNVMISLNKNDEPENAQINLNLTLTKQSLLINKIEKLDEENEETLANFNDQKYRKMLIDLIMETKESISVGDLRNEVIELFEVLKKEKNRSQFMKYLMIDLYNDDEQHGDIERAYRKENFNVWGKNYLYSILRFHVLEQCGNFRDMSLQLYGSDIFLKFRKIGNTIFMNLPIPEKKDPYEKSRNAKIKYTFTSDDSESEDGSPVIPYQKPGIGRASRPARGRASNTLRRRGLPKFDDDDDTDDDDEKEEKKPTRLHARSINKKSRPSISDEEEDEEEEKKPTRLHSRPIKTMPRPSSSDDEEEELPHHKSKSMSRKSTMRMYHSKKKSFK